MPDPIDATGALGSGTQRQFDLPHVTIEAQQQSSAQPSNALNKIAESAVEKIFKTSQQGTEGSAGRARLSDGSNGQVGSEKRAMQSSVSRPGSDDMSASKGTELSANDERMDALTDRAISLYSDMTVFNIAWGIATRTQRDISQLLRGS